MSRAVPGPVKLRITVLRRVPQDILEPFRKELESRESLVIPWTAPDSEVPHVEAGTSSDGRPARLALRE